MLRAGAGGPTLPQVPREPTNLGPGQHATLPAAHCGGFSAQPARGRLSPSPSRGAGRSEGTGPAEAARVRGHQHSDSGFSISAPSSSPAHALPGGMARGKNMGRKAQGLIFL